jgi:hypothetical protein
LIKSSLVEVIQSEPFAPLHLKARTVLLEDEDRLPFEVSAAND